MVATLIMVRDGRGKKGKDRGRERDGMGRGEEGKRRVCETRRKN